MSERAHFQAGNELLRQPRHAETCGVGFLAKQCGVYILYIKLYIYCICFLKIYSLSISLTTPLGNSNLTPAPLRMATGHQKQELTKVWQRKCLCFGPQIPRLIMVFLDISKRHRTCIGSHCKMFHTPCIFFLHHFCIFLLDLEYCHSLSMYCGPEAFLQLAEEPGQLRELATHKCPLVTRWDFDGVWRPFFWWPNPWVFKIRMTELEDRTIRTIMKFQWLMCFKWQAPAILRGIPASCCKSWSERRS